MTSELQQILQMATATPRPTTKARFKLPIQAAEAERLLISSYQREVENRGGKMMADSHTSECIKRVARWLTDGDKPSLLLCGGVGNGKTTMARSVMGALERLINAATRHLQSNRYRLSIEEIAEAEQIERLPKGIMYRALDLTMLAAMDVAKFDKVARSGLLVVDDFGCEPVDVKSYGTDMSPMRDIIYRRYDKMLPTIITTNLTMEDIRRVYGVRVWDRMREIYGVIGFNNKSYR